MPPPSDHFMDAFGMGIGSPNIVCCCGRRHYAHESGHIDKAERAGMEKDAAECPASVVLHEGEDSVYAKEIGGITTVVDCPCGWLTRLERLLWREREAIISYYHRRTAADAATAAETAAALARLGGSR